MFCYKECFSRDLLHKSPLLFAIFRFEIPMMIGKFKLPLGYSQDLECRVLEIPFKERRISLFILLPDDLDRGLARLEEHMSSDTIKALFSTLKVRNIFRTFFSAG